MPIIIFNLQKKSFKFESITLFSILFLFTLQSLAAIIPSELKDKYSLEGPNSSIFNFSTAKDITDTKEFSILQDENNSAANLLRRGIKHLNSGNKKQGINDLEAAWKMAPSLASPGVTLANVYIQDKKYHQALEVAETLKKNLPDKPYAFIIKGFSYQGLGNKAKSKAAFIQALKLNPGNPTATASLANYALSEKNTKQARELYLNALKYNPGHVRTLILLIRLDTLLGNTKQVEELVESALQNSPNTLYAHIEFVHLYEQLKNYPAAIREVEKGLKIQPKNPSLLFMYAQLLAYDKQLEASRSILKKLATTYPNNSEPKELEGKVALAQNRQNDAITLFQEALAIRNSVSLAVLLATTQIQLGDNISGLARWT